MRYDEPMALRLLSVVPRFIYPWLSGGEIRVGTLLRRLPPGTERTLLTFLEAGKEPAVVAASMDLEARHGIRTVFVRRTPGFVPPASLPAIARDFWDPAMAAALRRTIEERRVDVVQLEFTQMAAYAEHAAGLAPVVLTEHDSSILSPGDSYFRGEDGGPERMAAFLKGCMSHCRRVVAVSDADAARLEPLAPGKLRVVPTGAETERLVLKRDGRRPEELLFVGHYPHYPNEDAAVHLCRDILPLLKATAPGARAALVGSSPTPAVKALAAPDVEVVGTVPDVAPYLWRAGVFMAPMRLGFGIKGKVLEAFSAGLPVVATPSACEAMPAVADGRELLLATGPREAAQAAARLIGDRALADRLAEAAGRYVRERFGWERQARLLDAVLEEALCAPR